MNHLKKFNLFEGLNKSTKDIIIEKISFIFKFSEENSYNLYELNQDTYPLYYNNDVETHLIEVFHMDYVDIVVYEGYKLQDNSYNYSKKYIDLTVELLYEIYNILTDGILNDFIVISDDMINNDSDFNDYKKLSKIINVDFNYDTYKDFLIHKKSKDFNL